MKISIRLKNYPKPLESPTRPCDYGISKANSTLLQPQVATGVMSTTSNPLPTNQKKPRNLSSTLGSPPTNKEQIWKDKFSSFAPTFQPLNLSKTLDQDSITKDLDYNAFWKPSLEETYQKLWLPTETGFAGLGLNSSSQYVNDKTSFSQFLQIKASKNLLENCPTTSFQSLQFSQPDTTVPESIVYTRKIRILPSPKQKELFNRCIGASRYFYNQTLKYIQEKRERKEKYSLSIKVMRHDVMLCDKDIPIGHTMEWQKVIPYDTRDAAIKDALSAIKGNLTKLRNGTLNTFQMKFHSKKKDTVSGFKVNPSALLKTGVIFQRRLKNKRLRVMKKDLSEFLNNGNIADSLFTILKTKGDKWYICIPREKKPPTIETPSYRSVFLDPGVRTFQTFYSPDGVCGKIGGPRLTKQLKELANRHDKLWSLSSKKKDEQKVSSKTKRHMRKRCAQIREHIQNIVTNLHGQTCNFLCSHFQTIFLPEFKVANMVQGSPLGNNVTRKLLQLSHGAFRERLKWYATTHKRNVYIVKEPYTTKTCGCCGHQKEMNGLETFECPNCSLTIDRDYNGARNICLLMVGYSSQ